MINIRANESLLLLGSGVLVGVASVVGGRGMVVIAPLGEMVGKF